MLELRNINYVGMLVGVNYKLGALPAPGGYYSQFPVPVRTGHLEFRSKSQVLSPISTWIRTTNQARNAIKINT